MILPRIALCARSSHSRTLVRLEGRRAVQPTGAVGGAIVGGPAGAVLGAVGGAAAGPIFGRIAADHRTKFHTYVREQKVPSVAYREKVVVGATLPDTVTYREVGEGSARLNIATPSSTTRPYWSNRRRARSFKSSNDTHCRMIERGPARKVGLLSDKFRSVRGRHA
jgi:hypothetical protein